MAVFSVNQATQMYVDAEKKDTLNGYRWYETADGASELIKESNIIYEDEAAKAVSTMDVKAPVPTITVASPVKGAEYLVRLTISTDAGPQYAYIKSVGVVAADDNATNVATQISEALTKAAKRDVAGQYYTVSNLGGEKGETPIETVTITPVVDHQVGKRFVVPVISVNVSVITDHEGATTEDWVAETVATISGTGLKKLKDLEYFCAGEKGDVYRGAAWPNDIPFESKITSATPTVTTIHYYEDLGNEAVQKSEKTIILVSNN